MVKLGARERFLAEQDAIKTSFETDVEDDLHSIQQLARVWYQTIKSGSDTTSTRLTALLVVVNANNRVKVGLERFLSRDYGLTYDLSALPALTDEQEQEILQAISGFLTVLPILKIASDRGG